MKSFNLRDWLRYHVGLRLKHWFLQKVLRMKPICRCCDLMSEPVYENNHQHPVCELCDEYDTAKRCRTWA